MFVEWTDVPDVLILTTLRALLSSEHAMELLTATPSPRSQCPLKPEHRDREKECQPEHQAHWLESQHPTVSSLGRA